MSTTDRFNKKQFNNFQKALKKAASEIDNLSKPLSDIADRYYKSKKYMFTNVKTKDYVSAGSDLKESYKKQKLKLTKKLVNRAFIYPILLLTGRLRKSLLRGGADNITIVRPKSLTIGTSVPYAAYLEKGTKHMKKRSFLYWGPESLRTSREANTKELFKNIGRILFVYIERKAGKTLKASIKASDRKLKGIFK